MTNYDIMSRDLFKTAITTLKSYSWAAIVTWAAMLIGAYQYNILGCADMLSIIQFDGSPVTTAFVLCCIFVHVTDDLWKEGIDKFLFTTPSWDEWEDLLANCSIKKLLIYLFQSVSHMVGHSGYPHLSGNMSYILMLGPGCEAALGSWDLLLYIFLTSVGGNICVLFWNRYVLDKTNQGATGASGIAYMMPVELLRNT